MAHGFESLSAEAASEAKNPDIESEVADLLEELPEELAERWEDAHRAMGSAERKRALAEFLDKRKQALHENVDSDHNPEHVAVVETSPLALLNMIEGIEEGAHEKLGEGAAGRVIASVRYPNLCYKVMFPMDRIPKGTNDIAVEADLQDEIANLGEMHGVRAPKVYSFVHEKKARAITMERLDAFSLRDVIEGREQLPAGFDPDDFMNRLESYVDDLNARGYYHRDLHDGNVMIDRTTGMPYLIDFGYAKYSPLPDDAYDLSIIENGHKVDIMLPSDTASLRRLRSYADLLARGITPPRDSVK